MTTDREPLDMFLDFADKVMTLRLRAPLWAEKCPCGGEVTIGIEMAPAQVRKAQIQWWGRHQHCTRQLGASNV